MTEIAYNEADTCRKFVTQRLVGPHSMLAISIPLRRLKRSPRPS